ncbi:LytTR family DNA-binding domain-containing protein [uncultured Flavobacterium sp.]|uniref:LytR/AlgR family response regulator transcription factor n=1 Tax=uncultured Flavobacterium sp. TaxID=165435 RepID=UPI0030CA1A7B|tara:strand:+ start:883 stop:1560 length:678 start_codon:yes stop_codon:yes gene_type:complete
MKCIIIEDEAPAQQLLLKYINETAGIECIGVFESISELPLRVLSEIDFIFLDIQLPGVNGIDFLKNLEIKVKVIITTAYRDYAIDAFEEAVEDYLIKPFSYQRFFKAVMRVQKNTFKKIEEKNKELFVYADKTFYKIMKNDILYIKSEVDYVQIICLGTKLLVQDSLNNWEQKLNKDNFIRIHRSYLINFSKINKVEANMVYINEARLPVGKTYKEKFLELIKNG